MSLATIRKELKDVVKAAAPRLTVYSYEHPNPSLPAAVITWTDPIDMQGGTADGARRFEMVVRLLVGNTDPLLTTNGLDQLVTDAIPDALLNHTAASWKTANPSFIIPPEPGPNDSLSVDLVVGIHAQL